ncbi:hypothetical protein AB0A61_21630, partial [Streptomyces sp. NPDC046197]
MIVIKQAELTSAGQLHRYSREHLEDEHGGLTDQAIDSEGSAGAHPRRGVPADMDSLSALDNHLDVISFGESAIADEGAGDAGEGKEVLGFALVA